MVHLYSSVGHERDFLLKALLLFAQQVARVEIFCQRRLLLRFEVSTLCVFLTLLLSRLTFLPSRLLSLLAVGCRVVFLEAVVHLLQERDMVVELLQVPLAVEVYLSVVGDSVTKRRAVLKVRTAHPVVCSVVRAVGCEPVEHWNEVDRHLI